MVYGTNYRDVLLIDAEHAASDQIHVGRDFIVFQQGTASAHRARGIVALRRRETAELIGPERWSANSPDLNPVD